jgi:hypothetical protein
MPDPIHITWPDAVLLAALTAGVWTVLGAAADRLVAEARRRRPPKSSRRGPPLGALPRKGLRRGFGMLARW